MWPIDYSNPRCVWGGGGGGGELRPLSAGVSSQLLGPHKISSVPPAVTGGPLVTIHNVVHTIHLLSQLLLCQS